MSSIPELEKAVVEAAKAQVDRKMGFRELDDAVLALRAAEEAARKPRLCDRREVARDYLPRHGDLLDGCAQVIRGRDAEWLAAAKAIIGARIAAYERGETKSVLVALDDVRSDIEALVAETK